MEELQDAIEDAQYVNAISTQDDGPRPVLAWEIPTPEQLEAWKGPKDITLDFLLSSAIGLFLFSAYLKDSCEDHVRINFVEDVIRWRRLKGRQRLEKARRMLTTYFKTPSKDSAGHVTVPEKIEIDEYELERPIPKIQNLEQLYTANMDPSFAKCLLGLDGPLRDGVFAGVKEVEQARAVHRKEKSLAPESSLAEQFDSAHGGDPKDPTEKEELVQSTSTDATKAQVSEIKEVAKQEVPLEEEKEEEEEPEEEENLPDGEKPVVPETPDTASTPYRLLGRNESLEPQTFPDSFFDEPEAVVVHGLLRQYWEGFTQSEQYTKLLNFLWYQDRPVVPEDFFVMRVLGRGGFGLVTACKKGTSGKLYAMKVMNKRRIKMKKSEQLALNERQSLAAVESPFVVNLKYSFHSKEDIFLILDLMTGGDLGYHLHQKGRFPKKECQYYAARIMLGLQALHDKGYVYRDLKPENCLLADDGRVKITDLGLATQITPTLHGAAGTRGYWAPEMLRRDKKGKRTPYGHMVDWFSFGCCLAEFISGQNPFRSETALKFGLDKGKQTKEKAIDCATLEMDPVFDPHKFEPDASNLCKLLLDKNEKTRLGSNGCEEIMAHAWFKDINWEMIITDRKKPPFIPPKDVNAASQSEIGTFAEDKAYQETQIEPKDEICYQKWDWTNPRAFSAEVIEFLIYERETGEPLVPAAQHASCCCVVS